MVCAALDTFSVNICEALGATPLDTDNVTVNMPAWLGVPERLPVMEFKETPMGSVPVTPNVNTDGVPVAVTLNEPGALTVNEALIALVRIGAVGVGAGVTVALADALRLVPTLLVAVTEQE